MSPTTTLTEQLYELLRELNVVDGRTLDDQTRGALRKVRKHAGRVLGINDEARAFHRAAADLPDARSRTAAEATWRTFLLRRPWRGKIVKRADGSLSITAKTYTDLGTVIVYGGEIRDLGRLVEALEAVLPPLRSHPTDRKDEDPR